MLIPNNLNKLAKKLIMQYSNSPKVLHKSELLKIIKSSSKIAEENYKKIKAPKTCSKDFYIDYWIRETIQTAYTEKVFKNNLKSNNNFLSKTITRFTHHLSLELQSAINKKLYERRLEERRIFWESLNLPLEKINSEYKNIIIARNQAARKQGYKNFLEQSLQIQNIPKEKYNWFIINQEKVIAYCNKTITKEKLPRDFYSEFNIPCLICLLPNFPFKSLKEVSVYLSEENKLINKYKSKLKINYTDHTNIRYIKETDSFCININRNDNIRHQSLGLIHELGHFHCFLKSFGKEINPLVTGKYVNEKCALEFQNQTLKNLSKALYKTYLGEYLLKLRRINFELQIYDNPKSNLSRLYAESFNNCFLDANQKDNPLYLLDTDIVLKPLASLANVIAETEIIYKKPAINPTNIF